MTRVTNNRRPGMTLTELLVVIVILGLLMVTAIPVLVPGDERTGREAALTFTSAIARVKKRAARKDDVAALMLQAIQDDASSPTAMSLKAADLITAESRAKYSVSDGTDPRPFIYELKEEDPSNPGTYFGRNEYRVIIDQTSAPLLDKLFPSRDWYRVEIDDTEYLFRYVNPPPTSLWVERVAQYPLDYVNRYLIPDPDDPTQQKYPSTPQTITTIETPTPISNPQPGVWIGEIRPKENSLGHVPVTQVRRFVDPADNAEWGNDNVYFLPGFTKSATAPLSLPGNFVVDITWSCLNGQFLLCSDRVKATLRGADNMKTFDGFTAFHDRNRNLVRDPLVFVTPEPKGGPEIDYELSETMQNVFVGFTPAGDVSFIEYPSFTNGAFTYSRTNILPGHTLCFLIGRADRAGNGWVADPQTTPGANWQYGDSRWVSIQQNGTVTISNTIVDETQVDDAMADALAGIRASRY